MDENAAAQNSPIEERRSATRAQAGANTPQPGEQSWRRFFLKRIDWYILRKFLGTFVFSILLIIVIVIIFDISEKIEDFLRHDLSFHTVVFDYYLNFIPYFINLFSPLFTFIAVIFFTSRMASRTEVVAILNAGISFRRFLRPYMIGAGIIALTSLYLSNVILPHANKARLAFEASYIGSGNATLESGRNIYREVSPGVIASIKYYQTGDSAGSQFSLYTMNKMELISRMTAEKIEWSEPHKKWILRNYFTTHFGDTKEVWEKGDSIEMALGMTPKDFERAESVKESMTWSELNAYIESQTSKGSDVVRKYEIEKHKRIVFPFATFILTLIGVSLSSRKVRGGIGVHLGFGIAIAFGFILFMQIFASFAEASVMPTYIALWIPNLIFGLVALYLLRSAPK